LTSGATDDISAGTLLDINTASSYFENLGTVLDTAAVLTGNYRFNLWNGIWWGQGDEDNVISIVTNQDDSYWQIDEAGGNAQIYRIVRNGANFAGVLHDGAADTVGTRITIDGSIVSADYEDYAFVQFTINTAADVWAIDTAYTLGYGTALNSLTTEEVTLFTTDVNTAGTTATGAGDLLTGAAAATAEEEDGTEFYNIDVRYEVDGTDITFDVDFSYDALAEDFRGSVIFDMGTADADILTFWWLADFQVPAMENFNGDATTDITVADGDLKDNWSWVAYDVVIGESARFAVSRAVAAPAAVDVSFAGDSFTFGWVYYEGGNRNAFAANAPSADVTVTFPEEEEEEEEEESEGGESEEESSSASMIVSSIVSLLSLFVIFA